MMASVYSKPVHPAFVSMFIKDSAWEEVAVAVSKLKKGGLLQGYDCFLKTFD